MNIAHSAFKLLIVSPRVVSAGLVISGSVIALFLGFAAVKAPSLASVLIASAALASLVLLRSRLPDVFLSLLTVILIGYALFSRGFAYLRIPPLYVGEVVLAVGVLSLVVTVRGMRVSWVHVILIAFMTWGFVRTIPFMGMYGVDAARDAVVWAYGIFAIAVSLAIRHPHLKIVARWYRRFVPVFVLWIPLAYVLDASSIIPTIPGTSVTLLVVKGGDIGVHLAGAASFVLVGLWSQRSSLRQGVEVVLWPLLILAIGLAGSLNRGGLVTFIAGILAAVALKPSRHAVTFAVTFAMLASVVIGADSSINIGNARQISAEQIGHNIKSVVTNTEVGSLDKTKEWRLLWWRKIIDYTVYGPYRWTGKGFGVNLATDDGFQVTSEARLRSPHNNHMTVLARMGVTGLALWIGLQVAFGTTLLRSVAMARRRGDFFWLQILVWVLVYWLAMLVNSSFDVYLESPQGGIWFWTIFGLGLGANRVYLDSIRADDGSTVVSRDHPQRATSPLAKS